MSGRILVAPEIAAAAERVAEAAGDVTEDRKLNLWVGRAPILVAHPEDRLGVHAPDSDVRDFAEDETEGPAWRAAPEQEATPYFHITELTQAPPRRRAHRAALWIGLIAVAGTAAGTVAILQSPMRAQSDPVAVVSAAVAGNALGRLAQISAPDPARNPQAAPQATAPQTAATQNTMQAVPVIVDTPPAPQPAAEATTSPAAPVASPPAPMETLPESPQIAAAPADAQPAEEPAQDPATPPQISSKNEIGAAPVSMPQMPADPAAGQVAATHAALPVVVSSDGASPHVAAKLKPTQTAAASNPAAKPFTPQPTARPAQPVARPAANPAAQPANKPAKATKPTPEPIKKVLELLGPFMNGSKPQETEWGSRK
jgi:hypothetical protein